MEHAEERLHFRAVEVGVVVSEKNLLYKPSRSPPTPSNYIQAAVDGRVPKDLQLECPQSRNFAVEPAVRKKLKKSRNLKIFALDG